MKKYNQLNFGSYFQTIMHPRNYAFVLFTLFLIPSSFSQTLLEDFESLEEWKIYKSDGVEADISSGEGYKGKGVKFEYNFTKGTGYGGFQKLFPINLTENFQIIFYLKAESPSNNFEIKLIDSSGQNVWWQNNVNYQFPSEWIRIKIKKRHINFAWGPTNDKSLKKIDRIEFTIASYVGGKGSVYIDELFFEELPPEDNSPINPLVEISSGMSEEFSAGNIIDGNSETEWRSSKDEKQNIILDLTKRREFGGLVIDWNKKNYAENFDVY
ncbi:MAG: hypothetical protein EHM47_12725, partial [Ignavibacteriales bacterium]